MPVANLYFVLGCSKPAAVVTSPFFRCDSISSSHPVIQSVCESVTLSDHKVTTKGASASSSFVSLFIMRQSLARHPLSLPSQLLPRPWEDDCAAPSGGGHREGDMASPTPTAVLRPVPCHHRHLRLDHGLLHVSLHFLWQGSW